MQVVGGKRLSISRDSIKYVAMFTMLLNHISHVFLQQGTLLCEVFEDIGYFTAVTMCYFLVEGYQYTRSKKKYGQRLFIFACISQVPYYWALRFPQMNMLFTLFFCFLILVVQEKVKKEGLKNFLIILLGIVTAFSDWAILAAAYTLFFAQAKCSPQQGAASKLVPNEAYEVASNIEGITKDESAASLVHTAKNRTWCTQEGLVRAYKFAFISFTVANMLSYGGQYSLIGAVVHGLCSGIGILVSGILIIFFYNGQKSLKGRTFSKWFFYIFYPAHLFILGILKICL